jgi:Zn-finger nucleic acid-binding protein
MTAEDFAGDFETWLETLSPSEIEDLNALIDSVDDEDFEAAEAAAREEDLREIPSVEPKAKIRCKVCGFHKKPRKSLVETGVCKVCTDAISDGGEVVEVVGRSGKRGRNVVSVVVNGQRFKVKRLSNRHSEAVAAKHESKGKGYAKKPKAHVTDIESPKGLPTSSRLAGDERI